MIRLYSEDGALRFAGRNHAAERAAAREILDRRRASTDALHWQNMALLGGSIVDPAPSTSLPPHLQGPHAHTSENGPALPSVTSPKTVRLPPADVAGREG